VVFEFFYAHYCQACDEVKVAPLRVDEVLALAQTLLAATEQPTWH